MQRTVEVCFPGKRRVFLPAVLLALYRTADSERQTKSHLNHSLSQGRFPRIQTTGQCPPRASQTRQSRMACHCLQRGCLQHCVFTSHRAELHEALKQQLNCTSNRRKERSSITETPRKCAFTIRLCSEGDSACKSQPARLSDGAAAPDL